MNHWNRNLLVMAMTVCLAASLLQSCGSRETVGSRSVEQLANPGQSAQETDSARPGQSASLPEQEIARADVRPVIDPVLELADDGMVGSNGGIVVAADDSVALSLPPGAVEEETQFSIQRATGIPIVPGMSTMNVFELGPHGTQFHEAAVLSLGYSARSIHPNIDESELIMVTYVNGSWREVPGSSVDTELNVVSAPLAHLSIYGIRSASNSSNYELTFADTSMDYAEHVVASSSSFMSMICDEDDNGVTATVFVEEAEKMPGVMFRISYDEENLSYSSSESTELLRDVGPTYVSPESVIGWHRYAGYVQYLEIFQDPESHWFEAEGAPLFSVQFQRINEESMLPPVLAPEGELSRARVKVATGTESSGTTPTTANFNQSGKVELSDIVALAAGLGSSSGGGEFAYTSLESVLDGNADGSVDTSDVTVIFDNYGRMVTRYQVFTTTMLQQNYPLFPPYDKAGAFLLGTLDFHPLPATGRRQLSLDYITARCPVKFGEEILNGEFPLESWVWVLPWANAYHQSNVGIPGPPWPEVPPCEASLTCDNLTPMVGEPVLLSPFGSIFGSGFLQNAEISVADPDFNDPIMAFDDLGLSSVEIQFDNEGLYQVYLRISDGFSTDITSIEFDVQPAGNLVPEAVIDASPLSIDLQVEVEITFDASASSDADGTITTYEYDVDGDLVYDYTNADDTPVVHTYDTPGDYTVTLRVTDDGGAMDTDTVDVEVTDSAGNQPPDALFESDGTETLVGFPIFFFGYNSTDPDGTIVKYEWDPDGDGTFEVDTGANAFYEHTYLTSGVKMPALRVTDDGGLTDTDSGSITVNDPPALVVTNVTGDPVVEQGFPCSFEGYWTGGIAPYTVDFEFNGTVVDGVGLDAGVNLFYIFNTTAIVLGDTANGTLTFTVHDALGAEASDTFDFTSVP